MQSVAIKIQNCYFKFSDSYLKITSVRLNA